MFLSTKYLRTLRPTRKLDYKYVRPFRVKKVLGPVIYELELLDGIGVHLVFYISLLEKA